MPSSRMYSQPSDRMHVSGVSCIGRLAFFFFFYHWYHLGSLKGFKPCKISTSLVQQEFLGLTRGTIDISPPDYDSTPQGALAATSVPLAL